MRRDLSTVRDLLKRDRGIRPAAAALETMQLAAEMVSVLVSVAGRQPKYAGVPSGP
jgi:hypothetical protein